MTVLWWCAFLGLAWGMAYFRQPLRRFLSAYGVLLVLWTVLACPPAPLLVLFWGVGLVLVPLAVAGLRRSWLSRPLLAQFRRILPRMSATEREALEAGTVWWEGEFFKGCPDWRRLAELPVPRLSPEEQAFLDGPVERLCAMLDDWQITEELHDLPPEVWEFIRSQGFFGMIIPKAYGGLEFSALGHSCVVQKVASRSITAAVTVMVPNSLGPAELLLHYGTDAQKDHYLPRLARGEEVPCFALTGPEAGSDASSLPDRGVVCRGEFDGREVVGIRLDWEKRYITLGPVATVLGLAFHLYDPDHLIGDVDDIGITLALIPTDTPGIDIGRRHFPLDIPFQNGPNWGRGVFIPFDYVIGGQERVGQGWRMLMESLAAGRSISLPALSAGAGKLACRATGAYARIRRQFRLPIGRFEGVEEALARIAGQTYLMEAARRLTCVGVDAGEKPAVASAIVKYQLTERMRRVVNDAMDVQGGSGICLGPRNLIGRVYQAIPISITVEGANILTRSLIVFGQGAVRCHPYVLDEMRAAGEHDDRRALADFDRAIWGHVGLVVANLARALWLGLTGAHLLRLPDGVGRGGTAGHYRRLTRMSVAFAVLADLSMLSLGGSLKRRERLSGRLADILGNLYLASAALKRFDDEGRPEADRPLLDWTQSACLYAIQQAIDGLLDNLPNRPLATALRILIFPTGRPFRPPPDRLARPVVERLLGPSEDRDRLTDGIYAGGDPARDALARIDEALRRTAETERLERRIDEARRTGRIGGDGLDETLAAAVAAGLVDEREASAVKEAATLRRSVIEVDDFPHDYWTKEH